MKLLDTIKFFSSKKRKTSTTSLDFMKENSASSGTLEIPHISIRGESMRYEEVEIKRTGCKKCLRETIKLKNSQALENVSVDDEKVALVTINEEEYVYEHKLDAKLPVSDHNKESFTLAIWRVIPSEDLSAEKRYNFEEFVLKWNFLNQSDSLPFHTNYMLKYSKVYGFIITEFNYLYMSRCPLPIELYVLYTGESKHTLLGRADIKLKQALENIGKVYENSFELNNNDLVLCYKDLPKKHFGHLVCSYTFSGPKKRYESCKPDIVETASLDSLGSEIVSLEDITEGWSSVRPVRSVELKSFQDGLNLVLIRNKALRTTQDDIINELQERTTWMHEELKWRLTLQEHTILSGGDPNLVKWRQWKDQSTANVKYRPNDNPEFNEKQVAIFQITIVELQINPFSRISIDQTISQIYIEFSFLHVPGHHLETVSKAKPADDKPIQYNFIKTFQIRKTDKEAKQMAEMIRNNEMITFSAISEPIPDPKVCQNCVEIGHCQVSVFDLVESLTDVVVDYYPVYDERDGQRELGKLKVIFGGLLSLRALALHIMTPESFKIIR